MSQPEVQVKSFGPFVIKDADKGEVEAEVSSLDTVDHDREVVRSTAIKGAAKVKISFYGHDAVFGEAPVGKGTIRAENGKGVLRGKFFMSTTRGREAFETVKALGEDGEWSIGFRVLKWSEPDEEWRAKGAERMLDEIELFEVSPVLRGASPNTRTIGVKAEKDGEEANAEPTTEEAKEYLGVTTDEQPADPAKPEADADATAAEDAEAKRLAEEAEAKAREEADAKAALEAETKAQRARAAEAVEEFQRVQRALRRMGYAA